MSDVVLYLKKGYVLFDETDFDMISQYQWGIDTKGYVTARKQKRGIALYMHRLILGLTKRQDEVDHKNHIRTDNRRCNIRVATRQENARNSTPRGECKYLGVTYQTCRFISKKTGEPMVYRYIKAKINYEGRLLHLGTFKTEEDAAHAYNVAATKYYGEFANLNVL